MARHQTPATSNKSDLSHQAGAPTSAGSALNPALTRRTFLTVAGGATLSAAALLAGCGNGGSGNSVTLTHYYSAAGEAGTKEAVFRYASDYTKKNSNVKITVNWIPSDYGTKLSTALLSPNPPDVFEFGIPALDRTQLKAGLLEAVDDIYTADTKADFHPQDLQALTVNEKIYGVKTLEDFAFIYYRKSLFQKAGITKAPQTIDELIQAAQATTQGNVKGLFLGNASGARGYVYYVHAPLAAGVPVITDDGKPGFNNDTMAQTLLKLRELDKSSAMLDGAPTDSFDPGSFNSGLCAMQWCGFWAMPAILKQWGDDVDIFPFPTLNASIKPGIWYAGWANLVCAKGKHVAESKAYLKWLAIDNEDVQIDWNTAYGFHVPPRRSVAAKADKLKSGLPLKGVQLFNDYAVVLSSLIDGKVYTAFADAVNNSISKGADPKTELSKAEQAVSAEIPNEL